jgi:uncharacterized protein YbjT (DUF2867 family)
LNESLIDRPSNSHTGQRVLVAGATGAIGMEVVKLLRSRGYRVRGFSRSAAHARRLNGMADEVVTADALHADQIKGVAEGVSAVISCLGAPFIAPPLSRRGFRALDSIANQNLVREAQNANVAHFVYVATHVHPGYAQTNYVLAHEDVVDMLRQSQLSFAIVRPTGVFSIFETVFSMARLGVASYPGDGSARTNPVHQADVAEACVQSLTMPQETETDVGGPDIFTRDEIVRLAFRVLDKHPRIVRVSRSVLIAGAKVIRPLHPHAGDAADFVARVFTTDCIAPRRGRRRLEDYFRDLSSRS